MTTHEDNLALVTRILDDLRGIQAAYSEPTAELARRARDAVQALHAGMSIPANTPKPKRKPCSQPERSAWRAEMFRKIGDKS